MITNKEFLSAIFGKQTPYVHVTDFPYPPDAIPSDHHLAAWAGGYFKDYNFEFISNQYFCISRFDSDEQGKARRRKALFSTTHCIVLDDVKEKLPLESVFRLPLPSWVLESSAGSEQWGYVLDRPCADRAQVENLLDGLVARGLAPNGKDPGMKGVTRYVRLPQGINNKTSKGFFDCKLTQWHPFDRVTLEDLAEPFGVDLYAPRREQRVDGAANVPDHPILNKVHIKEIRSDGRYDITCPWVHEHTHGDDSGSAIFTNADGTLGFKCHHGSCESRNVVDVIQKLDDDSPGFKTELKMWQVQHQFKDLPPTPTQQVSEVIEQPGAPAQVITLDSLLSDLMKVGYTTSDARDTAQKLLRMADALPKIDQKEWHDQVAAIMHWSKQDLKDILKDLRAQWYSSNRDEADFYKSLVFVKSINQFYDFDTKTFYSAEAFNNSFIDQDDEARKQALQQGRVKKVDALDYAPNETRFFVEGRKSLANAWDDSEIDHGAVGDASPWLDHFDTLGWHDEMEHMLSWMACTLQRPDVKINHMLLLGGGEGCGKDFLLYPLIRAMGEHANVIGGEELTESFNEYALFTKYLHINELQLGDHRDGKAIANKLKPLTSSPPETLSVNQKGIKRIKVRNIINTTATTNSTKPVHLSGSRRYFAAWSDFDPRGTDGNILPRWQEYWEERWTWMRSGGWRYCANYLYNLNIASFNPRAQPPKTEFLKDIEDSSKSPLLQTIELFIRRKHALFACDLLTAGDMEDVLRTGILYASDMLIDPKHCTSRNISNTLREAQGYTMTKTRSQRIWVLRDLERYQNMSKYALEKEYEEAKRKARIDARNDLRLVN